MRSNANRLPASDVDLNLGGDSLSDEAKEKQFGSEQVGWQAEIGSVGEYLDKCGPRMPRALKDASRVDALVESQRLRPISMCWARG